MKNVDYSIVADVFDAMTTERINGETPAEIVGGGGGYPWPIAVHFVQLLEQHASLGPNDYVLDIGYGCGRIATALTQHIGPAGQYYGIDLLSSLTDFANRQLSHRYANFTFMVHEQESSLYERQKSLGTSPVIENIATHFGTDSINLVIATSLFTHLGLDITKSMFSTMASVLKADGRALITMFLLDKGARSLIAQGRSIFSFSHPLGDGVFTERLDQPLGAVAYNVDLVADLADEAGLYVERILYGSWSGRKGTASGQDVLILRKA